MRSSSLFLVLVAVLATLLSASAAFAQATSDETNGERFRALAVPPNCPANVWKLKKDDCNRQLALGCAVEFVGRGCVTNCNTFPLGCQNARRRFGDGGCKPQGWCRFQCRKKCDQFSHRCIWVKGQGCLPKE